MKQYKNLLVSGCSFSQDFWFNGIGGEPPSETSPGDCVYITDPKFSVEMPRSWSGFLAKKLEVTSFVNVAASAHGNILVAHSILECINRFYYTAEDTLVVINLSEPWRLDLFCEYDHPEVDKKYIPWKQSFIPYSYLDANGKITSELRKNIGLEQVGVITSNSIDFLFNFLQNKKIDFYFLLMSDFDNTVLKPVIDRFREHQIELTPGSNMISFGQLTKTYVSESNWHLGVKGASLVADQIYRHIKSKQE